VNTPQPLSQPEPEHTHADVRTYLQILWRRKWILLACVVFIPLAVYLKSASDTKVYEATATLQIQSQSVDTSLFSGTSSDTTPPDVTLNAAARLITTTGVAQQAAKQLRPRPANPRGLLGAISVKPDTSSGFITITASASDPTRSADLANAFASAVVSTRATKARTQIDRAIAEVTRDLGRLSSSDIDGKRQLSNQLQRLRALRAAQGQNAQIVEPAVPSGSPVSPKPVRNALLALFIAFLLGAGLALLSEQLDRKVRDPLDFEELTGTPLLGIVPQAAFPDHRPTADVPEAFQTLRASLTYFNINKPLRSVVITSPLKGDGKTTVATNLASAVARGGKTVILVDADLRHPQVDARIGERAESGLGAVLVGEMDLDEALVQTEIADGRLQLLPSGAPPPNPSELIGSDRMRWLLDQLEGKADLVIIDTPPALVVSDAIPLFERASGVVVIGRVDETTKDAMRRLTKVVLTAGGMLLGVVATGARGSGLYGYGYGAYGGYAPDADAGDGPLESPNGSAGEAGPPRSGLFRGRLPGRS
jgi:capsular exopolysaccharide synthesis family protein